MTLDRRAGPPGHEDADEPPSRLTGVLNAVGRLRGRLQVERWRRPLMVVASVVFLGASASAFANLPEVEQPVRWPLFLVAALVVPFGVAMNGAEYGLSAELLGYRVRLVESMRVAVVANAVNLLPVPGSVLVRTGALRRLGSGYGRAIGSTVAVSLGYVGVAGIMAGGLKAFDDEPALGLAVLAGGIAVLGLGAVACARYAGAGRVPGTVLRLVAIETGSVASKAARLYFIVVALGYDVSVPQAVMLTLPTVIASAVGIFPGGLGLRELLAGALGPAVGLASSVSLLATAIDRFVGLSMLGLLALVLLRVGGPVEPPAATVP